MSTLLFSAAIAVLLGGALLWAVARARRLRAEASARESSALAAMLGGTDAADGETILGGLPTRMPARGGIEVAEMAEVVDLDALLAGEPGSVASRARAQLEEPTNIDIGGLDSLPGAPARTPLMPAAPMRTPPAVAQALAPVTPLPTPQWTPPKPAAVPAVVPAAMPAATPARPAAVAPAPVQVRTTPPAPAFPRTPQAVPPRPAVTPLPAEPVVKPAAAASAAVPVPAAAAPATPRPVAAPPSHPGHDVPLRELALAWFEARGYRSAPASPAVRPIELVLRHKDDPARAYAFVVEAARVSTERVQNLRGQARAIGLVRLLIVASGGAAPRAAEGIKGVRLMDRAALEAEFKRLDISVAAKIIAVARKRSAAVAAVS